MSNLLFAYIVITALSCLYGSMIYTMDMFTTPKAKRTAARLILTCWAWPIWLLLGTTRFLTKLWKTADWKNPL